MPNFFKPQSTTTPAMSGSADQTFSPMTSGKPGFIGRVKLRLSEGQARVHVQQTAIAAIEKEALAIVKVAAEMQGQQVRAEHSRVHAQVLAATAGELIANSAAAYQVMGAKRFGGSVTNIEMRAEMLDEVERLVARGVVSGEDAEALAQTAMALHVETEGFQDRAYRDAVAMVTRAYASACATTKSINNP